MSFVLNQKKVDRIMRGGVTTDCPLFEGIEANNNLPNWIWNANEIKQEAFKLLIHFFHRQCVIYIKAMIQLGGEASDNDVRKITGWDPNIISARRNDLKKIGIIKSYPNKKKMGPRSVSNSVWILDFTKLKEFFIEKGANPDVN